MDSKQNSINKPEVPQKDTFSRRAYDNMIKAKMCSEDITAIIGHFGSFETLPGDKFTPIAPPKEEPWLIAECVHFENLYLRKAISNMRAFYVLAIVLTSALETEDNVTLSDLLLSEDLLPLEGMLCENLMLAKVLNFGVVDITRRLFHSPPEDVYARYQDVLISSSSEDPLDKTMSINSELNHETYAALSWILEQL